MVWEESKMTVHKTTLGTQHEERGMSGVNSDTLFQEDDHRQGPSMAHQQQASSLQGGSIPKPLRDVSNITDACDLGDLGELETAPSWKLASKC